jgi:hypothetical protein
LGMMERTSILMMTFLVLMKIVQLVITRIL